MQPQSGSNPWERLAYSLRIPILIFFIAGCFGVLLFLWVAFGGATPGKAQKYEIRVDFRDAAANTVTSPVMASAVGNPVPSCVELGLSCGDVHPATRARLATAAMRAIDVMTFPSGSR